MWRFKWKRKNIEILNNIIISITFLQNIILRAVGWIGRWKIKNLHPILSNLSLAVQHYWVESLTKLIFFFFHSSIVHAINRQKFVHKFLRGRLIYLPLFFASLTVHQRREGGNIGLFITLVPKDFCNNFGDIHWIGVG